MSKLPIIIGIIRPGHRTGHLRLGDGCARLYGARTLHMRQLPRHGCGLRELVPRRS